MIHSKSCDKEKFYVVTAVSNPARFSRRYELYKRFEKYMADCQVNLITVELQLGDRPFAVTSEYNPSHIQLRHWDELWHKENMLNIALTRLPHDWETVAWVDADISFVRKDWVEETLHQLQVHMVVQMFETAIDLGPCGQTLAVHKSLFSEYIRMGCIHPTKNYQEHHPGFCYAARREAIDGIGGLYDRSILGSGDRNMALSFIGKAQHSFNKKIHCSYQRSVLDYQEKCLRSIRKDVGFVPGTIIHEWHGKKKDRRYQDRWKILVNNKYNPHTDVKYNSYGVLQLHDDGSERFLYLRDGIRNYFRARNEDSIDLE